MSNTVSISATKREELGSASARRIRRFGNVPAVIYGHGNAPVAITVSPADADAVAYHTGLVEINCACGAKKTAIVKEVQRHPINPGILHVDFQEVSADEEITAVVPVKAIGEAAGTKVGGQLEQIKMEINVVARPTAIPEIIEVDVSGIEVDGAMAVKDIPLPAGVKYTEHEADLIVFQVRATKEAAEAAPAAEPAK